MSTYNGENYIQEQLDSILALQKNFEVYILVRDDGSSDGTVAILKRYQERHQISLIMGENLGVNGSMWLLLEQCPDSDYYAFCDQDDVWAPDKLKKAVQHLQEKDNKIPLLFGSMSQIVFSDLSPHGTTLNPKKEISYYNAMVQNVIPGHTQVFNHMLRQVVLQHGAEKIHVIDWWFYLAASAVGEVVFLPECTVFHRQHNHNAVGYHTSPLAQLWTRLKNIRAGKANSISVQLADFYMRYKDDMPEEFQLETERYFLSMNHFGSRLNYACTCRAYRQTSVESIIFRFLYLIGKYNYEVSWKRL